MVFRKGEGMEEKDKQRLLAPYLPCSSLLESFSGNWVPLRQAAG